MKFAKLFEIGDDQVLVRTSYDTDSDEYKLLLQTEVDGLVMEAKATMKSEEQMEESFNNYNQEGAENFYRHMKDTKEEMGITLD